MPATMPSPLFDGVPLHFASDYLAALGDAGDGDTGSTPRLGSSERVGWETTRWTFAHLHRSLARQEFALVGPRQRSAGAWSVDRQARFVESVVNGLPLLPTVLLLDVSWLSVSVQLRVATGPAQFVGGEQRLRALAAYVTDALVPRDRTLACALDGSAVCARCRRGDECAMGCADVTRRLHDQVEIPLLVVADSRDGRSHARSLVRELGGA